MKLTGVAEQLSQNIFEKCIVYAHTSCSKVGKSICSNKNASLWAFKKNKIDVSALLYGTIAGNLKFDVPLKNYYLM